MGRPPVSIVLVVVLSLTATLPGPTIVHAEGSSAPDEDTTTTTNMTRVDNQCSPLQRRQDLLDNRMNERDNRLNERDNRLNERDTDLNTRLNGLNSRQNEVDTRLNSRKNEVDARFDRIDSRFDDLETVMSDMKEYLRQRMDALEVKAEWALAGTTQTAEVGSHDSQPTRTTEIPKDCQEAYTMGSTSSGVYRIAPEPNTHLDVFCEQELDGGGWIVLQARKDGSVDFYQNWNTYKQGFGELTGEFWLGNTNLHSLTKHRDQQLKIELTSPEGEVKYADYTHFSIADEADKYRLTVTGYSGGSPPGDSLVNGLRFSTSDEDNDEYNQNCASLWHGGWWYTACGFSNINGKYGGTGSVAMFWSSWKHYSVSMKATRIMIRKRP